MFSSPLQDEQGVQVAEVPWGMSPLAFGTVTACPAQPVPPPSCTRMHKKLHKMHTRTLVLPDCVPVGTSARCHRRGAAQRPDDIVSPFPLSASCCVSCSCGKCCCVCPRLLGKALCGDRGTRRPQCPLLYAGIPRVPRLQGPPNQASMFAVWSARRILKLC